MSDYTPDTAYKNELFYYDRLIKNRRLTMRLVDMDKIGDLTQSNDDKNKGLLARAVIQPTYGYGINNTYSNEGGLIDRIINLLGSAITSRTGKLASEAITSVGELFNSKDIIDFGESARSLTNSHIFSSSELIKAFRGTSVNFTGVDKMHIKLIADTEDTNLNDVIKKINDYSIGKLYGHADGVAGDVELEKAAKKVQGMFEWVGVQGAPNNYKWSLVDSDKLSGRVPKTLTMWIGETTYIDNLLITSLNVTKSSQSVMVPGVLTTKNGTLEVNETLAILPDGVSISDFASHNPNINTTSPAWVEIEMSFEFARIVTSLDLIKMLI